jgi:hypothetical protein
MKFLVAMDKPNRSIRVGTLKEANYQLFEQIVNGFFKEY